MILPFRNRGSEGVPTRPGRSAAGVGKLSTARVFFLASEFGGAQSLIPWGLQRRATGMLRFRPLHKIGPAQRVSRRKCYLDRADFTTALSRGAKAFDPAAGGADRDLHIGDG